MRKILGNGLMVPSDDSKSEDYLMIGLLGPADKPQLPFAGDVVFEISTTQGDVFLIPLAMVREMIDREFPPCE